MTLVEFLRDRLAEDEQIANLISPGGYQPDVWRVEPSRSGRWSQVVAYSRMLGESEDDAAREDDQPVALVQSGRREDLHIARHDPARVLAEVEAKRRIVDEPQPSGNYVYRDDGTPACGTCGDYTVEWPCDTLKLLALPYADHPDYDPAWRP